MSGLKKGGKTFLNSGVPAGFNLPDPEITTDQTQGESGHLIRSVSPNQTDFNHLDTELLIDYLVNTHHAYLYDNLGPAGLLIEQVCSHQAGRFKHLTELAVLFSTLKRDLLLHLPKEEEVVFSFARKLAKMVRKNKISPEVNGRSMDRPIRTIIQQHKNSERILCDMRELTQMYQLPDEADVLHRDMLEGLKELDADLSRHMALEQTILFPKILAMELFINQ